MKRQINFAALFLCKNVYILGRQHWDLVSLLRVGIAFTGIFFSLYLIANIYINFTNNFSFYLFIYRDLQGNNITIIYETDFINLSKLRIL